MTALRRRHPLEDMAAPTMPFDLGGEIARLHEEADWRTGQTAKTLAKYKDFRIVLTVCSRWRAQASTCRQAVCWFSTAPFPTMWRRSATARSS